MIPVSKIQLYHVLFDFQSKNGLESTLFTLAFELTVLQDKRLIYLS
jgi:hypothetical protein